MPKPPEKSSFEPPRGFTSLLASAIAIDGSATAVLKNAVEFYLPNKHDDVAIYDNKEPKVQTTLPLRLDRLIEYVKYVRKDNEKPHRRRLILIEAHARYFWLDRKRLKMTEEQITKVLNVDHIEKLMSATAEAERLPNPGELRNLRKFFEDFEENGKVPTGMSAENAEQVAELLFNAPCLTLGQMLRKARLSAAQSGTWKNAADDPMAVTLWVGECYPRCLKKYLKWQEELVSP